MDKVDLITVACYFSFIVIRASGAVYEERNGAIFCVCNIEGALANLTVKMYLVYVTADIVTLCEDYSVVTFIESGTVVRVLQYYNVA